MGFEATGSNATLHCTQLSLDATPWGNLSWGGRPATQLCRLLGSRRMQQLGRPQPHTAPSLPGPGGLRRRSPGAPPPRHAVRARSASWVGGPADEDAGNSEQLEAVPGASWDEAAHYLPWEATLAQLSAWRKDNPLFKWPSRFASEQERRLCAWVYHQRRTKRAMDRGDTKAAKGMTPERAERLAASLPGWCALRQTPIQVPPHQPGGPSPPARNLKARSVRRRNHTAQVLEL